MAVWGSRGGRRFLPPAARRHAGGRASGCACQRCMAAVARQGDHAVARAANGGRGWGAMCSNVRRRPRSAAGKASPSPRRSAMYCAVHGPSPRIDVIAWLSSSSVMLPSSRTSSRSTDRAKPLIADARAAGKPTRVRSAPARTPGAGNAWLSPSLRAPCTGVPSCATTRPMIVLAPADADLLADDRAHAGLVGVPRAGHPQPGPRRHERPDQRVGRERLYGPFARRVEREDSPRSPRDRTRPGRMGSEQ